MARSFLCLFLTTAICLLVPTFIILQPTTSLAARFATEASFNAQNNAAGGVIMSKMTNATAKAELGRAGWKLLHTMAQRYPDKPTKDERETFKSFLHIFSRMYPCGECAAHFQDMLAQFPPQTSSRKTVSLYLCMLHNKVNLRLNKDEFDCTKLDGMYDCGCGDESATSPKIAVGTIEEGEGSTRLDSVTNEELIEG